MGRPIGGADGAGDSLALGLFHLQRCSHGSIIGMVATAREPARGGDQTLAQSAGGVVSGALCGGKEFFEEWMWCGTWLLLSESSHGGGGDDEARGTYGVAARATRAGNVLFSGPNSERTYGIYVVLAGSLADAEELAGQDPYHLAGIRQMQVWSGTLEGDADERSDYRRPRAALQGGRLA